MPLFGLMEATILIQGVIGQDYKTENLVSDVKNMEDAESIRFIIDSDGGFTDEGFAMASYIESLDKKVTTVAKKVYSIANVIFFASTNREAQQGASFMLHNAWMQPPPGNKNDLLFFMEILEREDQRIKDYIQPRSGLSDDDLTALMSKDTYLNVEQATDLGFFEARKQLRLSALAIKPNNKMPKVQELLNKIAEKLGVKDEAPAVANMDIELEDGSNIFVESEDGELEGKMTNAPAGTHRLKDGRTITVVETDEGNVVESVSEDSSELENKDEEKEMMKAKIEELEAKIKDMEDDKLEMKAQYEAKAQKQDDDLKSFEQKLTFMLKNIESTHKPDGKQPTFGNDAHNNPDATFTASMGAMERKMKEIAEKHNKKK